MLASVDEISGAKRKQNLVEHAEDARVSKQLATAVRDVPIDIDLEAELGRKPDRSQLRTVFRDWELRDPLRRLEEALAMAEVEAIPRPEAAQARTVTVKRGTAADIARLEGEPLALVVVAPETAEGELLPREERFAFGAYAGGSYALAGECDSPAELVAAVGSRKVVAHDAKALGDVPQTLAFDTEVAAYLLDPARRGYPLDELCEERGLAVESEDLQAGRAVLVHELAELQAAQLHERGLIDLLTEIELPLVHVLRETERIGIKLDTVKLEEVAGRIRTDVLRLEREIWEDAGEEFVIGSPQQLGQILFEKLELSRKRRGKTGFSTDARVLQAIRDEHPIIPKIERFRELSKLAQTYLDALPAWIGADGRLHTTFLQTSTATGRLASINPNLQNIPVRTETGREIRACFVAEPGNVLLSVDYSQVELRVLAHIAGEQVLKDIFERGEDVHTETAAAVFDTAPDQLTVGMRSKAKMVNYGIVYGLSAYGLADRLQIEQEEAQEFIDRYLERFPAVAQFIADADRAGRAARLRLDAVRPPPPGPGDPRAQLADAQARRAPRGQLDHPGDRRRHHQGRDGPLPRRARERGARDADDPADPRRAAVRGPAEGGGARPRDRVRRDGRRRDARSPAHGRGGGRAELARRQVAMDRGAAVLLTAFCGGLIALQAPINSAGHRSHAPGRSCLCRRDGRRLAGLLCGASADPGRTCRSTCRDCSAPPT